MDKHQRPPPYSESAASAPPPISSPPPVQHVTAITVNTQPQHGGTCPICHAGTFKSGFTLCGWLCCIFCFPCGILFCCCCMRQKKCNHCGFSPS